MRNWNSLWTLTLLGGACLFAWLGPWPATTAGQVAANDKSIADSANDMSTFQASTSRPLAGAQPLPAPGAAASSSATAGRRPHQVAAANANADMQYPLDVAVDSQGILYVADRNLPGLWRVRDGQAEIFFQAQPQFRTPLNAIRCVAVDSQDRVLAGCSTTTEVYRFEEGQPQPLTGGQISVPMNMVVGPEDQIYVCDLKLMQVGRIDPAGELTILATIRAPKAVALDGTDHLLVLTGVERPLLRIPTRPDAEDQGDGKPLHVFGGDMTPAEVFVPDRPFNFPADLARLDSGEWVVSDSYEKCLWKISPTGEVEKWVTDPRFVHPVGITSDGQQLFVADPRARAIFSVSAAGQVDVVYQSPSDDVAGGSAGGEQP